LLTLAGAFFAGGLAGVVLAEGVLAELDAAFFAGFGFALLLLGSMVTVQRPRAKTGAAEGAECGAGKSKRLPNVERFDANATGSAFYRPEWRASSTSKPRRDAPDAGNFAKNEPPRLHGTSRFART